MRIAVVHANVGNVRSVVRALERAAAPSHEVVTTDEPDVVRRADALVVPGQGAFGAFAIALDERGLRAPILERIASGVPYLGICLGMQLLFETSDEAPGTHGLGVLRGHVRQLEPGEDPASRRPRPLPHIGWNRVELAGSGKGIVAPAHYYFAHSYVIVPADPSVVVTTTSYGETFPSAVQSGRVLGVQFHPEKSQRAGLAVLERFVSEV